MQSFSVLNFKSFGTLQKVPIKPITLIYGANSAGKSSVLHSYLLLRHFFTTTECDVDQIIIGGDTLDLGGFKQFLYKKDYQKKLVMETRDNTLRTVISIDLETNDRGHPKPKAKAKVNNFELYANDNLVFKLTRKFNDMYKVIEFAYDPKLWALTEHGPSADTLKYNAGLLDKNLQDELADLVEINLVESIKNHHLHALKIEQIDALKYSESAFFKLYIESLIRTVSEDFGHRGEDLVYLGPLRTYPPRRISSAQDENNILSTAGGNAWEIVKHNHEVREKVNNWLGDSSKMQTHYKLDVKKYSEPNKIVDTLLDLFSQINTRNEYIPESLQKVFSIYMDYDEDGAVEPALDYSMDGTINLLEKIIQEQNIEELSELVIMDLKANTSVSHRDIGVGISQVLPVLVNAYASKNAVVAIEQPEIHLHPALQSELADVFINTALGENKNTYLLETHSEHLLLRIMRRIRETTNGDLPDGVRPITKDDVQILFVMPGRNSEGSVIKKIALDEEGEMIDVWPGGFFEEGYKERFGL